MFIDFSIDLLHINASKNEMTIEQKIANYFSYRLFTPSYMPFGIRRFGKY